MASVEFARERLFRIRLLLFIHHSDDHKTAHERVRHLVQGIPELLGLVGPGLSIGLCVERGSPALHAAHVEMRPPRMMRCALPFLCSFRPSRNLGHVEASSTYEPPSTLGVRQGATCALHLGLQIAASCSRSCCCCKLQRTGTHENSSLDPCRVPVRPRPRADRSCAHYDFYRFTSADYLSPPAPPQPAPTTHPDRERARHHT